MAENKPAELRDIFGRTLVELGKEYPQLLVLDADLHTSSKSGYFRDAFPGRFIQVGIAEQNLFGIAAGLALEGFIPMPSTFAAFAARRALDQIAISICYPGLNVKIPGSYVGLPTSRAGASHNCIEDIAIMRSLPNMQVADPGDNADIRAIMRASYGGEWSGVFPSNPFCPSGSIQFQPYVRMGKRGDSSFRERRQPVRYGHDDRPVYKGG